MHSLNSLDEAYRLFGLDPNFCGSPRRTGLTTSVALEIALDVLECPRDKYVILLNTYSIGQYLLETVNRLFDRVGRQGAPVDLWRNCGNKLWERSFRQTHFYIDPADLKKPFLNVHSRKFFDSSSDKCRKYLDRYGKLVHEVDSVDTHYVTVCSIDSVTDGKRSFFFDLPENYHTRSWTP